MLEDLAVFEQYLHERVNAHRIAAGVAPLAWSEPLAAAAREQAAGLTVRGALTHTGADGSTPVARMRKAGYVFEGAWAGAENVAYKTASGPESRAADVTEIDAGFAVSEKHVRNRLDPKFRQMGVGLFLGPMNGAPAAVTATETFAISGGDVWLTGVAFADRNGDDRFQPGEEAAALTVEATSKGGRTVRARVRRTGGYDLSLEPGRWTVRAYDQDGAVLTETVVEVGEANLKVDLVGPDAGFAATLADVRRAPAAMTFKVRTRGPALAPSRVAAAAAEN